MRPTNDMLTRMLHLQHAVLLAENNEHENG